MPSNQHLLFSSSQKMGLAALAKLYTIFPVNAKIPFLPWPFFQYSDPDPELLTASHGTLISCNYFGDSSLQVIDVPVCNRETWTIIMWFVEKITLLTLGFLLH